jgi:hypothetical protein
MKFFLFVLATAAATFDSCKKGILSITNLEADPPNVVAAGQPVMMRVSFTVPEGLWIPDVTLKVATKLNFLPVDSWEESLCSYVRCPLRAGAQELIVMEPFPTGIWGRVTAELTAVNASGTPLLCTRWSVWATGTDKNETGRWGF